jgi:hypothetical protein
MLPDSGSIRTSFANLLNFVIRSLTLKRQGKFRSQNTGANLGIPPMTFAPAKVFVLRQILENPEQTRPSPPQPLQSFQSTGCRAVSCRQRPALMQQNARR